MMIAVPLPYYSRYAHDICSDVRRGGWLWWGFRFRRYEQQSHWPHGVTFSISWGFYWRFRKEFYQ